MKYLITIVLIFSLAHFVSAQRIDPCRVFGTFFKVDNPSRADLIVYEEESEYFAQLRVYEEENRLYADDTGLWFFTDQIGFATYRVYFTKRRSEANFTVHFVDRLSKAGCD